MNDFLLEFICGTRKFMLGSLIFSTILASVCTYYFGLTWWMWFILDSIIYNAIDLVMLIVERRIAYKKEVQRNVSESMNKILNIREKYGR